jgi:hypothetical protein
MRWLKLVPKCKWVRVEGRDSGWLKSVPNVRWVRRGRQQQNDLLNLELSVILVRLRGREVNGWLKFPCLNSRQESEEGRELSGCWK